VHGIGDEGGVPGLGDVVRLVVGENADASTFAIFVPPAMQGDDDEVVAPGEVTHPFHAVGGGLVGELDGFPALGAVGRRVEVKDGPAACGVAGIPLGTDGDLALPIAIDVARGDADVVLFGELLGNDVLFPGGVLIPDDEVFITKQDVSLRVSIDIRQSEPVANTDSGIDLLREETGGRLGMKSER
jgi:hypothetical protein